MSDIFKGENVGIPENLKRGKFKILFIEDYDDSRETIRRLFKGEDDIQMTFFNTGKEALEALEEAKRIGKPFNLVVADWRIKDELSGVKMVEKIRNEELAGQTFILTIFPEEEIADMHFRWMKEGMGKVIFKEDIDKLPGLVHEEISRQRALQYLQK